MENVLFDFQSKTSRTPLHSFLGIAEDEYISSPDLAGYSERVS